MAQWLNVAIALFRQIVAFDIELQCAAKGDIEHLKPLANSEDRPPARERFLHGGKSGETILHLSLVSRLPDLASANLRLLAGYVKSTSMSHVDLSSTLNEEVERLSAESNARAIAVAAHDFESGLGFSLRGERWFHAASTIKV